MDLLSMLMNAQAQDMDGDDIGEVVGIHIVGGRLLLTLNIIGTEADEPDDGAKEDIPEPNVKERIRAISGGKDG